MSGLVGGSIALAAHSGKVAARTAVSASPEPASNWFLSLAEDAFAIGITWFATQHPYLAAAIVLTVLAIIVLSIRWIVRMIKRRRERRLRPCQARTAQRSFADNARRLARVSAIDGRMTRSAICA